jgi:outer membrane murein-binding lipoprotein Lpp
MFTRMLCVVTLIFCLATSGCLSSRYADRDSRDEVRKSKGSIDTLNEQMAALNKEIEALKKELQQIKEEKQKEVEKLDTGEGSSIDQTSMTKEKLIASVPVPEKRDEIQEVDIVKKEAIKKAPKEKPIVSQKEISIKALRMKVLSGNGKLSAAHDVSTKITKMGYRIEDIGLASRSDFKVTTVYYAPEYQKEAESLAARLGGEAISKLMTWPSVFHIILVAVP